MYLLSSALFCHSSSVRTIISTTLNLSVTLSTAAILCGIQLCTERCAVDQLRREPPCWGGGGEGGLARGDLDTR